MSAKCTIAPDIKHKHSLIADGSERGIICRTDDINVFAIRLNPDGYKGKENKFPVRITFVKSEQI